MPAHPFVIKLRPSDRAIHALRRVAWVAPFVVVWVTAVVVLRVGALSTDCTTVCLLVRGWLWYTVFYATMSLSAFVGAFEVLIWMSRLHSAAASGTASANH